MTFDLGDYHNWLKEKGVLNAPRSHLKMWYQKYMEERRQKQDS
jgi:hypothetical protein